MSAPITTIIEESSSTNNGHHYHSELLKGERGGGRGLEESGTPLGTKFELEDKSKTKCSTVVSAPPYKRVSPWNLFRFASIWDSLCIAFGFVASVLAGSCLPLIFLILGLVINEFSGYTVITSLLQQTNSSFYYYNNNGTIVTPYFCNTTELYPNYATHTTVPLDDLLKDRVSTLSYYCIGVAALLFVSSFLSNILWTVSALQQTRRMRVVFLEAILNQEIGYYDVNPPLELPSRLADDIHKIEDGIGYNFANFVQEFSGLFAGLIIAHALNWKLALVVSITFLPLLLAVMVIVAKISVYVSGKEQSSLAEAGGVAEEVLSAIKTVMAFGGERKETERYINLLKKAKLESYKKQLTVAFIYGFYGLVFFAFYSLGIWYGAVLLTDCEITGGTIVTVVIEIAGISFNINNALPLLLSITEAVAAAKSVYPIIDQVPPSGSKGNQNGVLGLEEIEGEVKFTNVTFRYPSRPTVPVLGGVNLHIKPGQTVGLVGPSGCGKSTLFQVLQRLYTHTGGMITIDGVDITNINVGWLRSQIGVVSQEPLLFNVTIAENISYGKEGATSKEIAAAARAANAFNFIAQLPEGFNTLVGEGGAQLSGGEKQRIAIARALIRNPKILLLDEATSALDTESEKVVQEALDKARVGRTTIIIAHRLSTIYNADSIAVMDKGEIVEMGTHDALMDRQGLYCQLVHNQTIGTKETGREFAHSVRQSVKRHVSFRPVRQTLSNPIVGGTGGGGGVRDGSTLTASGHHTLAQAPSLVNTITRNRRLSSRQAIHEEGGRGGGGRGVATARRFNEGRLLPAVSEINMLPPPTPKTPKFSPHHLYEFDNVFEDSIDGGGGGDIIQKAPWRQMLRLSKPDWWLLLSGLIGFVLFGVLLSSLYVLFSEVIEVFSETDKNTLLDEVTFYSALYIAVGFIGLIVNFIATYSLSIAADRLTTRLRQQSFETIMKQDMSFFDDPHNSVSVLTGRLALDTSEVNQATGLSLGLTVRGVVNIFANYIIIFQASWPMGLVSLITLIIFLLEGCLQLTLTNLFIIKSLEHQGWSLKTAIEAIDSIYTIISLGIERKLVRKYEEQLKPSFHYDVQGAIIQSLLFALAQSCSMFVLAGALIIGAYVYTADPSEPYHADFDSTFRAIGAMLYTGWLFKELFRSLPDTQSAQIAASRILSLLNTEEPIINSQKGSGIDLETNENYAKLELDKVHFSYPSRPGISIFSGISLTVKPGKTLAIVGPSGSGKSTILGLVERFYDVVDGSIVLNNDISISIPRVSWLRRQLSLVSQDPVLFNMSVADNIRYGALYKTVTDGEVIEAAKSANIHEFVMSLPRGYDTPVGSKGTQLSGGEKQRIAIARALIRNPKILLLDEATSALDTESEKVVQEALDKARVGRTTIIIAHRLSTIYNADSIAVIHEGKVVEQGTHDELMNKRGHYFVMNTIAQREITK